jgi:hypothetical protein
MEVQEVAEGFREVLKKLCPDEDQQVRVMQQLTVYQDQQGIFSDDLCIRSAKHMPGHSWYALIAPLFFFFF